MSIDFSEFNWAEARAVEREWSPIDLEKVKPLIIDFYKLREYEPPTEFHVGTPKKFREFIKEKYPNLTGEQLRQEQNAWTHFGNMQFPVYSLYTYQIERKDYKLTDALKQEIYLLKEIMRFSGFSRYEERKDGAPPWVYICEKPLVVKTHIDNNNQPHNVEGPAVAWSDLNIWCIEGNLVDEQIVMRPETQTTDQILNESNLEIRRIRIERFGWDRFLAEINAECIDKRDNFIENTKETLFRCEQLDSTVMVSHCPSTGRIYALEVPDTVATCEEAQLYLSGGHSLEIPIRSIGRS